jgi:hypothetical protein
MKSCLLIIAVSIFTVQYLYSQNEYKKDSLSFSIGASIPVGNFASTANIGECANFSFDHKINKQLALIVMLYAQRNGLNTSAYAKEFAKTAFFADLPALGPRYYSNWIVDKKSWYMESLQIGIAKEIPFSGNNKISFIAKALVGAAYAQLPKLYAQSFTDTSYAAIFQNGASAFGLSYSIGAELKYKLNRKFDLIFNAAYFGTTQISFKNITQIVEATNGLTVPGIHSFSNSLNPVMLDEHTGTDKQPIGSIIVNFGVEMRL